MRGVLAIMALISLITPLSMIPGTVAADGGNTPPTVRLISPADGSVIHDPTPTFVWEAEDADGDNLTFDLYEHHYDPSWLFISPMIARNINSTNFTLTKPLWPETYVWNVRAYDGHTQEPVFSGAWLFTVGTDSPPALFPVPDQSITVGEELRFELDALDPDPEDQGNLTFKIENAPDGAMLDPSTHVFTWRPTAGQEDNYNFKVTVSDPYMTVKETAHVSVGPQITAPGPRNEAPRYDGLLMGSVLVTMFMAGVVLMFLPVKGKRRRRRSR
jgi:hypothetical protein